MNKVGIITFCDNTNYGSYLQTYALYKAIEELGLSVELIDYRKDVPDFERVSIKGLQRIIKQFGWEKGLRTANNIYKMQREFDKMIANNMKTSRRFDKNSIRNCRGYSTYVVGSDLVWDVRYAKDYTYMLDFVKDDSRKISYAASYGYERIPEEEREIFIANLSSFAGISVREINAKKELCNLLGRNIYHVCDPTMLLSNDFWKALVGNRIIPYDYAFVYLPDPKQEILKEAKRYSRKHGIKTYFVDKSDYSSCPWNPREFLNLIYYSNKVFTASYHGVLFSLYFEKELSYIKGNPSNRLDTISKILDIETFDMHSKDYNTENTIDYISEKKLEEEFRQQSRSILREMLIDDKL